MQAMVSVVYAAQSQLLGRTAFPGAKNGVVAGSSVFLILHVSVSLVSRHIVSDDTNIMILMQLILALESYIEFATGRTWEFSLLSFLSMSCSLLLN